MGLKKLTGAAIIACAALAASLPMRAGAELITGAVFQPQGENLMISTPPGWRMAYMDGRPDGDYVVDFLPPNEAHDSWREGYMGVQRRSFPDSALLDNIKARNLNVPQVAMTEIMQGAQRNCPGRFQPMGQKNTVTNGIPTSVSGGFCDRAGAAAPYGEGSVVAVFQGRERLFVVQFGWRPATPNELKEYGWRITPARLQQYLDLINGATLCGGPDQGPCPK
ncbi:hypothetical protein FB597_109122 [Herbaspirillum sp. SJZ099]|nr:hypothetical protein [Herbaspirillum sp. SJZ099]TWC64139.1 hypothetical protein FB597_109122 [Herbaspirillum sp. SJZ099]